jgi:hypothetical protein
MSVLYECKLDSVVWNVLGGSPAKYELLLKKVLQSQHQPGFNPREAIGDFLSAQIYEAVKIVNAYRIANPKMDEILSLLGSKSEIPDSLLVDKQLLRPTPDKVLRLVERNGVPVLIPTTSPINVVLRHNLTIKPSVNELVKLFET